MGTLKITTVTSDPSGTRDSGGLIASGGTHEVFPHAEQHDLSHTFDWISGSGQVPVVMRISPDVTNPGLITIATPISGTIDGQYTGVFPVESIDYLLEEVDSLSSPEQKNVLGDTISEPYKSVNGFNTFSPIDTQITYTVEVDWTHSSSPPGTDVFTVVDTIYMNFWKHRDYIIGA